LQVHVLVLWLEHHEDWQENPRVMGYMLRMFSIAILKMEKESACDAMVLTFLTMHCLILKTKTEINKATVTDKTRIFHRKTRRNWHNSAKTGA